MYNEKAVERSSSKYRSLEDELSSVKSLLQDANAALLAAQTGTTSSPASTAQDGPAVELISWALRNINGPLPVPHSDDLSFLDIAAKMDALSLDRPGSNGYLGKSSQAMLVKAAIDLKDDLAQPPRPRIAFTSNPCSVNPWEQEIARPAYTFPEDDLAASLVSLYFTEISVILPLLHRRTFEGGVATGLHFHDHGFAGTLLLVCALGAWYSDDPRVYLSGDTSGGSAGWKWYSQVQLAGQSPFGQTTLYDLQCYCLATQFLERASGPRAAWKMVGFGLRLAQDIGAHRKKASPETITLEAELEKRAYWIMVVFDAQLSSSLGRSYAMQNPDYDVDLPVGCEGQIWEAHAPHPGFVQQPTPARIDFFRCIIRLNRIMALALKVLYGSNDIKRKIALRDEKWQSKIVMEFDSALNEWFEGVPAHLRWDASNPDDIFFDQSAALHCSYYLARIFTHRPFIPAIHGAAVPMSIPSLSVCNTAARACIHVAEIQHQSRPKNPLVFGQTAVFTAGVVLLLNVLGGDGLGRGAENDLADVQRCITILRAHKTRWASTGPLIHALEQLVRIAPVRPPRETAFEDSQGMSVVTEPLHSLSTTRPEPVYPPSTSFSDARAFEFSFADDLSIPPAMNTATMWSAAPTNFGIPDWELYLNSLIEESSRGGFQWTEGIAGGV